MILLEVTLMVVGAVQVAARSEGNGHGYCGLTAKAYTYS